MNRIAISKLGKAYKSYRSWASRLKYHLFGIRAGVISHWVLRELNFNIESGESVGILGINGAGKSTLLKLITGTISPSEGSVRISGKVAALLELGLGFHPDFTGRQNVVLACQLQGMNAEEIDGLMPSIIEFSGIGRFIDEPLRVYSSGMQVRLAFSVATAVRPDILIVDEALSVGDAAFQAKCYRRISEYKKLGTTLLLVTHSTDDVVKHCSRAILLSGGSIVGDGEARQIVNMYREMLFGNAIAASEPQVKKERLVLSQEDVFDSRPNYYKEEHRWGNKNARIIDYVIFANEVKFPAVYRSGAVVRMTFRTIFHADCENPIFGVLIKTLEGLVVYGTNSAIVGISGEKVLQGDSVDCEFEIPILMNRGSYLVSLGVADLTAGGEEIPLDRRYDSIMINVENDRSSIGLFELGAKCTLERV